MKFFKTERERRDERDIKLVASLFRESLLTSNQWLQGDKSITEREITTSCIHCGLSEEEAELNSNDKE